MNSKKPADLHGVLATLSQDGCITIAGNKLSVSPALPEDKAFIISTWIRSYQPIVRRSWARIYDKELHISEETFKRWHPRIAESLWHKATVAKDPESNAICAYIVYCIDDDVVHYVYVVPELRNMGISKILIKSMVDNNVTISHNWPYRIPPHWKYDPYSAMRHCNRSQNDKVR